MRGIPCVNSERRGTAVGISVPRNGTAKNYRGSELEISNDLIFAIIVKWESIYGLRLRMSHAYQRDSIDNLYLQGIRPVEVPSKQVVAAGVSSKFNS